MLTTSVIEPPRRLNLPRFADLWFARDVAARLAQRDIIVRYRQTVLGVLWVIIQPVMAAGVFSLVFGTVAKLSSGGLPYFVFSLGGTLAWNLFNNTLTRASGSLIQNQSLVAKVFFPRILVPLSTAASTLLDFLVGLGVAVVMLFVYHIHPGWAIVLLPVWMLFIVMLSMGLGMILAAMTVKYRDVGYVMPWAVQILMYASPVAYTIASVPHEVRWAFVANPITWFLDAFRWSLLGTAAPELWQIIGLAIMSCVVLFAGIVYFQSHERAFADLI